MRHYSISKRLLESYLRQPYSWFLSQNSSDLEKNILSEVQLVVRDGLSQLLDLVARVFLVILLTLMLIIVDLKLTILVGLFIAFAYGIVFYLSKNYLKRIGNQRLFNNNLRFRIVSEAFNAIKEIKLGGLTQNYIKIFSDASFIYAKATTYVEIIKQLPRFFLETLVFGGILLVILYLINEKINFISLLPILSLYIFTGYRLMPAFQQIYASLTLMKFVEVSLDKLLKEKLPNESVEVVSNNIPSSL